jgi:uncharacterized protein YecA (UPF0149 family)
MPALLRKVEEAAGGFAEEEEELVKLALDERLLLHGYQPLFNPDRYPEADSILQQPVQAPIKVGRNDPCPCGSGKKFKKCCGAE